MIFADDLGWSDCTLYGNIKLYHTPNLERHAKRGLTFTRAYSSSPLSSPARAVTPLPNPAFDKAKYRPDLIGVSGF